MVRPSRADAGDHVAKADLFELFAEVAAALGSGRRAEIVDLLAQGERPVEEVAAQTVQSMANASHHLRTLARAGLVRSRRDGTRVYYRLAGPEVEQLWLAVRRVAEAERDDLPRRAAAYLGDLERLQPVRRAELLERLAAGSVVVLDVRPAGEYRTGHVPGARCAPPEELDALVRELPPGVPVVAYCRGPYCVFAPAAVRALRARGIEADRLEAGFPEWRAAGLPVAVGDEPGQLRPSSRRRRG